MKSHLESPTAEDGPATGDPYPEARCADAEEPAAQSLDVEEVTSRLPTSELIKIIKNALEYGKRNVPFTETDLLRAMTLGQEVSSGRSKERSVRALGQSPE